MLDAERMKLVFHLGGSGFTLPVDHLVEILQVAWTQINTNEANHDSGLLGHAEHRGRLLPVYALNQLLGLVGKPPQEALTLLVLTGRQGPWGVWVDRITGIFPEEAFRFLALPELLQPQVGALYSGAEAWQNELLLAGDAGLWAAAL